MVGLRLAVVCLAALAFAPSTFAHPSAAAKPPYDLRAFLLRPGDLTQRDFPRTPAFAWYPVRGATHYEFQLSSGPRFRDGDIVWSNESIKGPAVSIPVALPWKTGSPFAFYARVRAITPTVSGPWSASYGFNMRWADVPQNCAAAEDATWGCPKNAPPITGLLRWSLVEGATAYHVWFLDAGQVAGTGKVIATRTNAADEREFYAFHQFNPWMTTVRWRVRAVRAVYGTLQNGLPAVSYGPWSPVYTTTNPAFTGGPMTLNSSISDVFTSATDKKLPHSLTPGFSFSGNSGLNGTAGELYRVYVASDSDCVNIVFRGAVVGGPAYVPRMTGPLALPPDLEKLNKARNSYLSDGGEGATFMADHASVTTTESDPKPVPPDESTSAPSGGSGSTAPAPAAPAVPGVPTGSGAPVDLWDSGWPESHYYWTVVPVRWIHVSDETGDRIEYHDIDQPQDACAAGRVMKFGKESEPVVSVSGTPYVAGLSPQGRLTTARNSKPTFYGSPLVTWQPALGADEYELQWSKKRYPWKTEGKLKNFSTSALLPLAPGTWYYRIRGIDYLLPGTARAMSWSTAVQVKIARPTFTIVGG
jgi:hypothetical protein